MKDVLPKFILAGTLERYLLRNGVLVDVVR